MFFQFTLGPVQSFVAQARRTRDFWVGSFLLSYLTGHAMMAVIKNNGRIIFPVVQDGEKIKDPLLDAIKYDPKLENVCSYPTIGSIPNRFMAEVPDDFDGNICKKVINDAWLTITNKIWQKHVSPIAYSGKDTEEIWQRQVNNFWEMSWVMGSDSNLLDRRKNWRNYIPPEEPGDKCTLMGNWQELSGYVRVTERVKQDEFWQKLSKITGKDLRPDERLCSIALIKRLFPHLLQGDAVTYPSTSYMAAVPWLKTIINDEKEEENIHAFAQAASTKLTKNEKQSLFFKLNQLSEDKKKIVSLNGTCFFASTLENDNLWPKEEEVKISRNKLKELLKNFRIQPSPFYALLVMDGDRIGSLLSDEKNRVPISQALADFSSEVDDIIKTYQGLTVYAGGDDVVALLPLGQAMNAAAALRESYLQAFKELKRLKETTISAAIVYAYHHAPLRDVIAKAQQILDEEAKEKTGRDALAVAVWNTGGTVISWSVPWVVRINENQSDLVVNIINQLQVDLANKQITNSWIYGIRKLLGKPLGNHFEIPEDINIDRLFVAELLDSRDIKVSALKAEEIVKRLLTICVRQFRDKEGNIIQDKKLLSLDGALLVKFLVTKGVI